MGFNIVRGNQAKNANKMAELMEFYPFPLPLQFGYGRFVFVLDVTMGKRRKFHYKGHIDTLGGRERGNSITMVTP